MKETAYLLQSALISAWWVGLASSQAFFDAFQFEGIPPTAFWALFAPDVGLIASLSAIRAYRKWAAIDYVILGGFAYATLYCANATLLTNSGYLPTGLMFLGLGYNLFVCFHESTFRTATTNVAWNAVKTAIQIACIWLLALAVIPYVILDAFGTLMTPLPGLSLYVGSIVFACCSMLGLTSAFFMVRDGAGTPLPLDQTNRLVVSGPYRFVRNPMAIAGIGQGIGIAIALHSVHLLVYSLLGAVVWHLVVRPSEERDMLQRFGDSYVAYRDRVSCWIPNFRRESNGS
ncbi:MAG: isoprenylcysteine carboxylmethyltransferase family protein [Planctomycetota bacterium]